MNCESYDRKKTNIIKSLKGRSNNDISKKIIFYFPISKKITTFVFEFNKKNLNKIKNNFLKLKIMKTKTIILLIGMIVSLALLSCERNDNPEPDENPITSTGTTYSVRYNITGGQMAESYSAMIVTSNTLLQYTRIDIYFIDSDLHSIELTNHNNKTNRSFYNYNELWFDTRYNPYTYDMFWQYYSKLRVSSTREIAGKICNVYVIRGEFTIEVALWNKILMYYSNEALQMEATTVTFDVPENAFSEETIDVDWI